MLTEVTVRDNEGTLSCLGPFKGEGVSLDVTCVSFLSNVCGPILMLHVVIVLKVELLVAMRASANLAPHIVSAVLETVSMSAAP